MLRAKTLVCSVILSVLCIKSIDKVQYPYFKKLYTFMIMI